MDVKEQHIKKQHIYGLSKTDIREMISIFKLHIGIEQVILFGSRAKGNFRNGSDIDLALKGDKLNLDDILNLLLDLDELYLPYKIDMIIYHHIDNQELMNHIKRVGVTLFERKP